MRCWNQQSGEVTMYVNIIRLNDVTRSTCSYRHLVVYNTCMDSSINNTRLVRQTARRDVKHAMCFICEVIVLILFDNMTVMQMVAISFHLICIVNRLINFDVYYTIHYMMSSWNSLTFCSWYRRVRCAVQMIKSNRWCGGNFLYSKHHSSSSSESKQWQWWYGKPLPYL